MPDLKISQLTSSQAQSGDLIPVARSGANFAVPASSVGALEAPVIQTNSVNNATQSLLNIVAGTNVTVSNTGGAVTINASAPVASPVMRRMAGAFASPKAAAPWNLDGLVSQLELVSGGGGGTTCNAGVIAGEGPLLCLLGGVVAESITNASWCVGAASSGPGAGSTPACFSLNSIARFIIRQRGTAPTAYREWAAATDIVGVFNSNQFATDTPNGNVAGFRFSTAAGDTHWMAYCGTSSAANTAVSTGVSYNSTTATLFEFGLSAGVVTFYINGNQVATINTNVPNGDVTMQMVGTMDNCRTNSSQCELDLAYAYAQFN